VQKKEILDDLAHNLSSDDSENNVEVLVTDRSPLQQQQARFREQEDGELEESEESQDHQRTIPQSYRRNK